jgi:hypothetical protein
MVKLVLTLVAVCMLGFVLFMHVTFHKGFADVALGYAAGLVVAGCALAVHCFYKKGEVR